MPYRKDFSTLWGRGELSVAPEKWTPLTIEYGYGNVGTLINLFWRIKSTTHTFRIPIAQLNEISKGDYESHIESFLEIFREDYLSWATQGFCEEWMREYHEEYKNCIIL